MRAPLLSAVVASAFLSHALPSRACSCAPPRSVAEDFSAAAAVFEGQVIDHELENTGDVRSTADPVQITLRVLRRWKGADTETVMVRTAADGVSCGAMLELHKKYLVFASEHAGALHTGLCSRTDEIGRAGETLSALGDPLPATPRSAPSQNTSPSSSPPPEPARSGCAGCTAPRTPPRTPAALALLLSALLLWSRRLTAR